MRITEFITEAANPAQQAAIAISKKEKQGVAEGEVKHFPKKHTGDLDDVHDCVKCGGDLQGATYQGHRVKVCVPCKQVYLPPNSGIDQKGNKISEQDIEEQETTQKILKAHNPETIKKWVSDAESEGWVVKSSRTFPSGQIKVIMVKKQGVAEAAGSREKFSDLNAWAAAAKQQGLRVGPANGDSNYSYWAVGKGGEVFGKFVTTRVPQNNHGYIKKQGVAEGEGGLGQVAGIGINGKQFNFSIKDLIAKAQNYPVKKLNPQLFVKQLADRHEDPKQTAARAQSADLQYPIIVVQDGNTLMIADGTHRAQKAIMNKLPAINAHVIPVKDMAEFSKQGVAEDDTHQIKGNELIEYLMKRFDMTREQAIELLKKKGLAEDWQKVNHHDKTDGMSGKAVKAYRRENPGSKLKTAVTTKPSKLKAGSKDANRRKSFCARMGGNKGPMKDEKGRPTPKAKALSRWNCESIEQLEELVMIAEQFVNKRKNESI